MRLIIICDKCKQWNEWDSRELKTNCFNGDSFTKSNLSIEFSSSINNIDDVQNMEFNESDLYVDGYELTIRCNTCNSEIKIID